MPAQPKLFEGPALEPLLEQINREVGANAKILRAEKTREGGVMGFFAREQYRLTVQPPPPVNRKKRPSDRRPASTKDAPRTRRHDSTSPTGSKRPEAASPSRGTTAQPRRAAGTASGSRRASSTNDAFTALVESTVDQLDIAKARFEPPVASAHDNADEIDAVDESEIIGQPEPIGDRTTLDVPCGEFSQWEEPGTIIDADLAVDNTVAADQTDHSPTGSPAGHRPVSAERSFDAVLRRVAMALGDDAFPADPTMAGTDPTAEAGTIPSVQVDPVQADPVPTPPEPGPVTQRRRGAHLARPATLLADDPAWDLSPDVAADIVLVAERLRLAGLDGEMVDTIALAAADGSRFDELLEAAFAHALAPPPLPTAPGSVVVVVGQRHTLHQAARALAVELGASPHDTVVVDEVAGPAAFPGSGMELPAVRPAALAAQGPAMLAEPCSNSCDLATITTAAPALAASRTSGRRGAPGAQPARADALARLARHLTVPQRPTPVVVALQADFTRSSTTWAAQVLDTVRPAAVWAAVDAVTKPEDITAWASALGGVDALVLDNVAGTVSPAAVLRSGIPVARLDGRPATPARWAHAIGDLVAA